jgi:dihydroflavonol-4-reductase
MVVVTGGTGHVGNVLVRELARRREHVRAVVPAGEDTAPIAGLGVEVAAGDVRHPDSLARAFAGADVVFHLAGVVTISTGMRALLNEVNVRGTRNVVEACLRAEAGRLVYASSVHALPEPPHGVSVCETSEFTPSELRGDYAQSKALASIEVLRGVKRGLDAVMVFPSGVIGPYDFRGSEMGELIRDIASGRLSAFVDGAYDFVDVRDVVQGLLLAAARGRTGEGYILSGEKVTVRDLIALVGEAAGVRARPKRLPYWLARAAAAFTPLYYRLVRRRPRFTAYSLKVLVSNCTMDSRKAERELGFSARPVWQSIAETVAWLRRTGRLPDGCLQT